MPFDPLIILEIYFMLLMLLSQALAMQAPCGPNPRCPDSFHENAQRLQDAWLDPLTTNEQRAAIKAIVEKYTDGTQVDWANAAVEYLVGAWAKKNPQAQNRATDGVPSNTIPDWQSLRDQSETYLRASLVDPQSANFDWPYGFSVGGWKPFLKGHVSGYFTCGFVNAKNRFGGYTGRSPFVVVVEDASVKYAEIGQPTGMLAEGCAKASEFLPPAQFAANDGSHPMMSEKAAEEIRKIADLRSKNLISDEEFLGLKNRIIAGEKASESGVR